MELIKLCINLFFLFAFQMHFSIDTTLKVLEKEVIGSAKDTLLLAIPSVLYIVQDYLIIFALSCLDAATYQVGHHFLLFFKLNHLLIIVYNCR